MRDGSARGIWQVMVKLEGENQESEERSESPGEQGVTGLGAFLQEEREKKGLSLEDMEAKTRLRPHVLAAIEAEKWDTLPQPVFVRGFIRSYGKALGLDKAKVGELCNLAFPKKEDPPSQLDIGRTHRKRTFLYLILGLIVVGGLAYLLQNGQSSEKGTPLSLSEEQPMAVSEYKSPEANREEVGSTTKGEKRNESSQESALVSTTEDDTVGPVNPVEVEGRDDEKETTIQGENNFPQESESGPPSLFELKGLVSERTWIKICIDDEVAEEYIFQPGSQPSWQGKKGFRVVIGNAAGISFEFNGIEHKNLGKVGQVVKLAFPENFVSLYCED